MPPPDVTDNLVPPLAGSGVSPRVTENDRMSNDRGRVFAVPPFSVLPFAFFGVACIVASGIVSAAIAPAPTEHGVWASAYLVLVGGVAQVALGIGQAALIPRPPTRRVITAQVAGWNFGNAAVIAGTLLGWWALVDVGGALLVAVLAGLALRSRTSHAARTTVRDHPRKGQAMWLIAFRGLLLLLLVSIPIGLVLERIHPT